MQMRSGSVARRWLLLLPLLFVLSGVRFSSAEEPDVAKLRDEGMTAYQLGNYKKAEQAFDRAYAIAPLHSLGIWSARSRVKLGQWLEADERFDELIKKPVPAGAREESMARDAAAHERDELRKRMPHLRFRVEGAKASELEVRVDGVLVPDEFLVGKKDGPFRHAKAFQVNPGSHQILAVSVDQRLDQSVEVNEGETRDVNLRFANSGTLRQRKCRDQCRTDCHDDNDCYVNCKERCFSKP
jgi:tetratricopeptide (TPR) repeat protein